MKRSDIPQLPDTPGVYLFKAPDGEILYVGKATSLKDRVRSYFNPDLLETRGPLLVRMVNEAGSIDHEETETVIEALILEASLIKRHMPRFNTKEKDDKSFTYVLITKEEVPRVLVVRGRDLIKSPDKYKAQYVFGPFPQGASVKEALRLLRKIFPFFSTERRASSSKMAQGKVVFNRQLGLLPADMEEYQANLRSIQYIFQGKKKQLLKELEREMHDAAKREDFEHATLRRKQLFALTHIQEVSLIKKERRAPQVVHGFRIEAYDVAHLSGTNTVGVMTVIEDGEIEKAAYRKFTVRTATNNDPASLKELLERRLAHPEWAFPQLIVVDGGEIQKRTAERVLHQRGHAIPVVSVVKDEHHKPRDVLGAKAMVATHRDDILLANAEAHRFAIGFHRQRRSVI